MYFNTEGRKWTKIRCERKYVDVMNWKFWYILYALISNGMGNRFSSWKMGFMLSVYRLFLRFFIFGLCIKNHKPFKHLIFDTLDIVGFLQNFFSVFPSVLSLLSFFSFLVFLIFLLSCWHNKCLFIPTNICSKDYLR